MRDSRVVLYKYGKLHQEWSFDVREARTFLRRKRAREVEMKTECSTVEDVCEHLCL